MTLTLFLMSPTPAVRSAQQGVTLTEYAVLIALVAVAGFAGLQLLGQSTSGLLRQSTGQLDNGGTLSVLKPIAQPGGVSAAPASSTSTGNSGATLQASAGGQPTLAVSGGAQGVATNVSSIEGKIATTVQVAQTMSFGFSLAQMAAEETDPSLKKYYQQLAKQLYYLGGVEGNLSGVNALKAPPREESFLFIFKSQNNYNNSQALVDINTYKSKVQNLLASPPSNIDGTVLQNIRAMGGASLVIASTFNAQTVATRPGEPINPNNAYDKRKKDTELKQTADRIVANQITAPGSVFSTFVSANVTDKAAAATVSTP